MQRKTPFSNILDWLNVSINTFTEEADKIAKERNERLESIKDKTGKAFEESPLIGTRNMGEYSSGQRTLPRDPQLQERIFDTIILFFEKRYDVLTCGNYVQLTTQFINNLSSGYPLPPEIFDYAKYIKMIESESLPEDPVEFGCFIQRSCFMDFLVSFVNSWNIIKSPKRIQHAKKNKKAFEPHAENAALPSDRDGVYMQQSLHDASGNDVFKVDPYNEKGNLLYLLKEKLVLVTGPGGQGKSTLLKSLRYINSRCGTFDKIVLIPLVALTSINMDYKGGGYNIIFDYIEHRYPEIIFNDPKQKILIMLDGFNEYRTAKNSRAVENITGSLNDLVGAVQSMGDDGNISLVVTTRDLKTTVKIFPVFQHFKALSLSGTPESEYQLIRSMCEERGVEFIGTELEELAKTPLYARLIKRLIEEGREMDVEDRFSLFDKAYKARAEQRIGNTAEKSIYPKNVYLYFYYVIQPYLAYRIVTSSDLDNTYRFSRTMVYDFLNEIRKNGYDRILFAYLTEKERFRYIDGECPQIDGKKLMEFLDNEEDCIICDDPSGEYSFEHEEWRDYLAAGFLKDNFMLLRAHYRDSDGRIAKEVKTNLNVDAEISRMLRQSLGLFGGKKDNSARMKMLFRLDPAFFNHLDGTIRFLHTGFSFCDYLQIDLPLGKRGENRTVHTILQPLSDYMLDNASNSRLAGRILGDGELVRFVCELLSKETEYYRRIMDYDKAYRIVALCKKLNNDSVFTRQHEAKVYLCYYESAVLNEELLSEPKEFLAAGIESIWNKGLDLLQQVADRNFYLSVNTKGLLMTNPAPYLIRNGIIKKPDFTEAFRRYIRMITDSEYVRRDTSYTVQQALRLLVDFISIDDDSMFDPEDCNSDPDTLKISIKRRLFTPLKGEKNLRTVRFLLNKCAGQELAGLNYLRGCAAMASGDEKTAQTFFESPLLYESTLLYHLMLKYRFGQSGFDIGAEYDQLIRSICSDLNGKLDKTHMVYRYIEARELELSFLEGARKEARKEEFDRTEREGGISETVSLITSFLNA